MYEIDKPRHRTGGFAEESQADSSQLQMDKKRVCWLQLDLLGLWLVCALVPRSTGFEHFNLFDCVSLGDLLSE